MRWKRPSPGNGARRLAPLAALLALCCTASPAAEEPNINDVISAIVGVRAVVPADARTAPSLGTERQGSGIVIRQDGLVVTIGYLIMEASEVEISVAGQTPAGATIVAYDHNSGFGLLRMNSPFTGKPMPLADSSELVESSPVLVASYGGLKFALPARVVSRRVFAGYWEYLLENAIFTSPPHPLFGGAALIGPTGKLLGVGSLIVGDAVSGQHVPGNLFVPISGIKPILDDLLEHGRSISPIRPWLGIYSNDDAGQLRVTDVAIDGPAAHGGIHRGDLILAVANEPVSSMAEFYRQVWALGPAGTPVPITVLQGSEIRELELKSDDRYNWLKIRHPQAATAR